MACGRCTWGTIVCRPAWREPGAREASEFLARQLLAMPAPALATATVKPPFAAPAGRLVIIAHATVATAYEDALSSAEGRDTWRTGRLGGLTAPCPAAAGPSLVTAGRTGCRPAPCLIYIR